MLMCPETSDCVLTFIFLPVLLALVLVRNVECDWPPPASLSWGPQSLEPAWGYLAMFSPSAFTMVSFCGFPAD